MRNWHAAIHDGFVGDCPWQADWDDVQVVCEILKIPCKIWDFSKEYYADVVEYFFREYEAGRTPNPDVMCNKYIKFGKFLDKALAEGVDYVATGHYARLRLETLNSKSKTLNKFKIQNSKLQKENIKDYPSQVTRYSLLTGVDSNKDQSYFLWTLTQEQLRHVLFPIGELEKPRVRALAKTAGLPTYDKKDSQGICFIGNIDVQKFLRSRLPEKIGDIITINGQKVGEHSGAYFFTEGQRKGIDIGGTVLPYYVAKVNVCDNTLTVVEGDNHPALFKNNLTTSRVNWIAGVEPEMPLSCQARIRYRQAVQDCIVEKNNGKIMVNFKQPQRAVSPGQSIVFYQSEECLGGGIIN